MKVRTTIPLPAGTDCLNKDSCDSPDGLLDHKSTEQIVAVNIYVYFPMCCM